MNHQAVHPQLAPQGNQQQPQHQQQQEQQPDPMFENGARFFQGLQENRKQEYSQFKKLNEIAMRVSIMQLQYWRMIGGPQNQNERERSRVYLLDLKQFRLSRTKERISWKSHRFTALFAFAGALGMYILDETKKQTKGQHSDLWIGLVIIAVLWSIAQAIRFGKNKLC